MSKRTIITKVKDLPKTLDFLEYLIVVKKRNKFYKAFLYTGYSGHAMQDVITDYYKEYTEKEGYSVSW